MGTQQLRDIRQARPIAADAQALHDRRATRRRLARERVVRYRPEKVTR